MKILFHIPCPTGLGDDRFIYDGYKYAWEDKSHQFYALTENDDLRDSLNEIKPDIFITAFNLLDLLKVSGILCDFRKQGGKVFMSVRQDMPENYFHLIKKGIVGDIFFGHLSEEFLKDFKKITGYKYYQLPLAASKKHHFPTQPVEKYKCDIVFIGANLPKKQELFKRRLFPLFKKYSVKVYGTDWTLTDKYFLHPLRKTGRKFKIEFLANLLPKTFLPIENENMVYSSAKICLNFHEIIPEIGGVNGRTFRIPACGGFEICDYLPEIRDYFSEKELVMVKTDEEFFEKIDYYLNHEEERKKIQERGIARALRDHTYHNRVEQVIKLYKSL